nr:hypothetical protein [uncultured Flavobacterium sp.]
MNRKLLFFVLIIFSHFELNAQSLTTLSSKDKLLGESKVIEKVDSLKMKSENWGLLLDFMALKIQKKDTTYLKWLNTFDLDLKTFQNKDSTKSALGFTYNLNIERAKITEKGHIKRGKSISLETKGNVSFNKEVNPYNFLNTKLALNLFRIGGGVTVTATPNDLVYYANLRRKFATYESPEAILNAPEWHEMNEKFKLKNSWILKYDLNAGLESNQDFSKKQSTLGMRLGGTLKSWNKNSIASKLNILDYPFAAFRKLTQYKGTLHSGITLPTLLFGFDYVNPIKDTLRKKSDPNLKPFPRMHFEAGFRTVITEISSQTLFFNSSFKYFKEINASNAIKNNSFDSFSYFTAAIASSSGVYVCYSNGKLPFDRRKEAIYEIGFKYQLD